MKKEFSKRPPRSDARQNWDPFVRLPKEWEAVKQAMLQRVPSQDHQLLKINL